MKLVIEVAAEDFDATCARDDLLGRVEVVEVCQEGGLLSVERRLLEVVPVSNTVADQLGLGDGPGPAIRALLARKEET